MCDCAQDQLGHALPERLPNDLISPPISVMLGMSIYEKIHSMSIVIVALCITSFLEGNAQQILTKNYIMANSSQDTTEAAKVAISFRNAESTRNLAVIHLVIENRSDKTLTYNVSQAEKIFEFKVLNDKKQLVPLTNYGAKLLSPPHTGAFTDGLQLSWGSSEGLKPGAVAAYDVEISKIYQMTAPGIYTIEARWTLPLEDKFIDQSVKATAKEAAAEAIRSNIISIQHTAQGLFLEK